MNESRYLGDGLHARFDGYQIELLANDSSRPTDTVYLPYEVMQELQAFADQCWTPPDALSMEEYLDIQEITAEMDYPSKETTNE